MYCDPIVDEVRKAREAYASQFNFNLRDMIADLQRRQRESGRKTVSFPPKRKPAATASREDGNSGS
jgi:hypothetical protein